VYESLDIERRIAGAERAFVAADGKAGRLSWARLGYFVLAVLLLAAWRGDAIAAIVTAIPFVLLVAVHRRAVRTADRARGALAAARGSQARSRRDWAAIPSIQAIPLDAMSNRPAIGDLDVYGDRALFRLLDVSQPGLGGSLALRWLLDDPAPLAVIEARQASVVALRTKPDLLLELARLCRHGSRPAPGSATVLAFRKWGASRGRSAAKLIWTARILTALFGVSIVAVVVRPELLQPLASTIMTLVAGQFIVAGLARRYLHDTLREADDQFAELASMVDVLRLIATTGSVPGRFGQIQQELKEGAAVDAIARLSRLFAWNGARHSPMLLAALDGIVAYDAHLAAGIDNWREAYGSRLDGWIDLVAEAQAIAALATLACENPDWTMPRVHDEPAPVVTAAQCGHPLLADNVRVGNPVSIDRPGSAIVVSGSNMSGKTTYLRAVGLNALLALAGGPVCARGFTVRRSRLRTTVRIEDDLGAGVSLFMAEVSRIAQVVTDASRSGEPPVLFLFDEILHGTNAQDRREATQLVLARLLAGGAAGLVTTHDPRIADALDPAQVTQAHFTDTIASGGENVTMTFDYVLRPGPATTTNALRILRALGL
jgi:hypothetical protein